MKLPFPPKPISFQRGYLTTPNTLKYMLLDSFFIFTCKHLHAFSPYICILFWNLHISPNNRHPFLCQASYFPFKNCCIIFHVSILNFEVCFQKSATKYQSNTFISMFLLLRQQATFLGLMLLSENVNIKILNGHCHFAFPRSFFSSMLYILLPKYTGYGPIIYV